MQHSMESSNCSVEEKRIKIKEWVKSRLEELDQQNQRIRTQNILCANRLELLYTCAKNNLHWRNCLMTASAEGTRMLDLQNHMNNNINNNNNNSCLDGSINGSSIDRKEWSNTLHADEHSRATSVERSNNIANEFIDSTNCGKSTVSPLLSCRKRVQVIQTKQQKQNDRPVPLPRATVQARAAVEHVSFMRDSLEMALTAEEEQNDEELAIAHHRHIENEVLKLAKSCFLPDDISVRTLSTVVDMPNNNKTASTKIRGSVKRRSPYINVPLYLVCTDREHMYCRRASGSSESSSQMSNRDTFVDSAAIDCRGSVSHSRSSAKLSFQQRQAPANADSDDDYSVPPDAASLPESMSLRCVMLDKDRPMCINGFQASNSSYLSCTLCTIINIEKQGYLHKVRDPGKPSKRRWFVLRDDILHCYRSSESCQHGREKLWEIPMTNVISIARVAYMPENGFEIATHDKRVCLVASDGKTSLDWFKALQKCRKTLTMRKCQEPNENATCRGWITKVHYGRSKRFWCALCNDSLLFFKRPTAKVPLSHLCLEKCTIREAPCSSADESDGEEISRQGQQHSLEVRTVNNDLIYLIFLSGEDKERWFYHLTIAASGGPQQAGSAFEQLINQLMKVDGQADSQLWKDPLISTCVERPTSPMTKITDETDRKTAFNLYKSAYLFSSVQTRGGAEEYHLDLAQNALRLALANPTIRDEFYALLIKLTNSEQISHQAWRLLAMCLSLFLPSYPIMWLMKKYLRNACLNGEPSHRLAAFCQRALERTVSNGARTEAPSKLEIMAFLTRDPCEHSLPHSIPVNMPDGSYQVIGFDGSSTVIECSQRLCQIIGIRPPVQSGYGIFADDPRMPDTLQYLNPNEKLCDVLSRWERQLKEHTAGKVPNRRAIQLLFRRRFYWPNFARDETDQERVFLAYQLADDLREDHVPVSVDLAVELCALMAQLHYGSYKSTNDNRTDNIIRRTLSEKLISVACRNSLKSALQRVEDKWKNFESFTTTEAASVIVQTLRLWPYFGASFFEATIKGKTEESLWLAVDSYGITLMQYHTKECINTYSYDMVTKFGGMNDDFVLVVQRTLFAEDEAPIERIVFAMENTKAYEITLLLADYITHRPRGLDRMHTMRTLPSSNLISVNV
ncbi:Pleckstrin homology domain-containing family H member 2 [Trichinella pseudospiralis]|uniref:Pleckstrin homology domain-containing family H member 2 n=1 Tax=Trichinella pseudospiralis TaxID=6337 RepID=A0A0V1JSS5_TRIPS|nr:Pleckstrin homology domain-containing family H member 2 [Trichinella pseudospiralis]KRZ24798.1 Pleckstrin homology domain-containing family H member 2 [Trichinella pseudospiralis]KRZ38027.1 Pleckstrin homology domain-containing family H member 2 [Trichinella pseudospiralis]